MGAKGEGASVAHFISGHDRLMTDSVEPSLLVSFFLIVLALKGSI